MLAVVAAAREGRLQAIMFNTSAYYTGRDSSVRLHLSFANSTVGAYAAQCVCVSLSLCDEPHVCSIFSRTLQT